MAKENAGKDLFFIRSFLKYIGRIEEVIDILRVNTFALKTGCMCMSYIYYAQNKDWINHRTILLLRL